jgi:hypothetical protein
LASKFYNAFVVFMDLLVLAFSIFLHLLAIDVTERGAGG